MSNIRVGYGEDSHKLVSNRPLIIGNVVIPDSPHGALAHSDGDVLLHALADALLSSASLGDIGHYFPPTNPAFKNINSAEILQEVLKVVKVHWKIEILNLVGVVILDEPKLGELRSNIQKKVAQLLDLEGSKVGFTFKTSEGLAKGYIQARATVLLKLSKYS